MIIVVDVDALFRVCWRRVDARALACSVTHLRTSLTRAALISADDFVEIMSLAHERAVKDCASLSRNPSSKVSHVVD